MFWTSFNFSIILEIYLWIFSNFFDTNVFFIPQIGLKCPQNRWKWGPLGVFTGQFWVSEAPGPLTAQNLSFLEKAKVPKMIWPTLANGQRALTNFVRGYYWGGFAELLPFLGKSEAYTLGKGGDTPLGGGVGARNFPRNRWRRSENFFGQKFRSLPENRFFVMGIFSPG